MNNDQTEQSPKPVKKTSLSKKIFGILIPLLLGVLIIWFLYRDTPFDKMWLIIENANYAILAFSLIFGLLGNVIRAYRWKMLIKPLGYNPKTSNLIFGVLGNYAVNFVLPRAGEFWRCGVVSKYENIPFVKLFGTIILDRILDTLMVALIALLAFALNMEFFISYLDQNQVLLNKVTGFFSSPWLYIVIATVISIIVATFKAFKHTKVIEKIRHFFKGIANDMVAIWGMKQKTQLILCSIGIWASYFLYFYTTFFAFGFTQDLGIIAGLIAFAISSISMALPTNGGLGAWHLAVIGALTLYSVSYTSAEAFAFAVFAVQSLWVIVCGLVGIMALAVKNRNK